MADQTTGQWEGLRDSIVDTPELRAEYERTKSVVMQTRELLQCIDAEREQAGLSKAALAARIGVDASVVRRLFSAEASNPTLRTVLELADALGMRVTISPARRRRPHAQLRPRAGQILIDSHRREAVPA